MDCDAAWQREARTSQKKKGLRKGRSEGVVKGGRARDVQANAEISRSEDTGCDKGQSRTACGIGPAGSRGRID